MEGKEEEREDKCYTYCLAGALCLPPSKPGGRTVYDALVPGPPTGPRFSAWVPDVPAVEEVWKPGSMAQHSRVEWLFWALMTVMFRVFGAARERDRKTEKKERKDIGCMIEQGQ